MLEPNQDIVTADAIALLREGESLKNYNIKEALVVEGDSWTEELVLENCIVESFACNFVHFEKAVRFTNTHFKNCHLYAVYFIGGLTIENCTFDNYVDFQSGGHNKPENPIRILNCDFKEFINFFDCWFNGPITLAHNNFRKGTNIESVGQMIIFDFAPMVESNIGETKIDRRGK